jgi:uncharacterized membrane protein
MPPGVAPTKPRSRPGRYRVHRTGISHTFWRAGWVQPVKPVRLFYVSNRERDVRNLHMSDTQLNQPRHPAFLAVAERRSAKLQLRVADAITAFAGSMRFVYLHGVVFAVWMLVFEKSPWPTLTLIVSLEAIFLSTFVMIGQNRQASFQQAKADHDFVASELELHANTELTKIVHQLTTEIHARLVPPSGTPPTVGEGGYAAI